VKHLLFLQQYICRDQYFLNVNKNHINLFFAFILFVFAIPQTVYSTEKVKTIVVFFAMDANLPAYQGFLYGLNGQLSQSPDQPYNLIIEYMDIIRFSKEGDLQNMVDVYNEKYKSIDLDMIIMFGPGTFQT